MRYEYICTKCGKEYFSNVPIENQTSNKCEIPGCGGKVVYTKKQKMELEKEKGLVGKFK